MLGSVDAPEPGVQENAGMNATTLPSEPSDARRLLWQVLQAGAWLCLLEGGVWLLALGLLEGLG